MNDQHLADALEFASVQNFYDWLDGRLVRPYFIQFEEKTQCYKTTVDRRKGAELSTIEK